MLSLRRSRQVREVEVAYRPWRNVDLAKIKRTAAHAEKRLQKARHENLTASGRLPSKSLNADILELDNLVELSNDLS